MNYPLISEYIESIKAAKENFEELKHLRPVLDEDGEPVMTSGNFAVVFKMKDEQTGKLHAVKCFLKDQEGRAEAYRMIAEELEYVNSTFLTPIKYLDKELFVDSKNPDESEFPVLLMDWVEGQTLDKYIQKYVYSYQRAENLDETTESEEKAVELLVNGYELENIAYQFSCLSIWLLQQPFAHGDLKPDNIIVKEDGRLVLVDYDGMYVPAMKGQKARELGSPDFRHPLRNENDFDEHIDDFPLSSILLSLLAIANEPSLLEKYGGDGRLLLSERDYRNIAESEVLGALRPLMADKNLTTYLSLFYLCSAQKSLFKESYHLFTLPEPAKPSFMLEEENLSTEVTDEDLANAWTDEYGVKYSKDRKRLLKVPNNIQKDYTIRIGTKVICDKAFSISKGWKSFSVSIPKGVEIIGKEAFRRCNGLDDIVIPSTVKKIEYRAFESCQYLKSVQLSYGLKSISEGAFADCIRLNSIIIPNSVISIGSWAFSYCKSLSKFTIPNSVREIGVCLFHRCENLKNLEVEKDNPKFDSRDACNAIIETASDSLIAICSSTIIPKDIRRICACGFAGLDNFSSFSIPTSVIEIGDFAFKGCRELISISIPNGVKCIGNSAFHGCKELSSVTMPESLIYIGNDAFALCSKLSQIKLPRSLKKIGASAFGFSGLERICIPQNVDEIGRNPFEYCTSLIEICVHKDNPFYDSRDNCHSIVEKKSGKLISACINSRIPHGIKAIGESAFSGSHISSIVIPSSVREIEDNAFSKTSISSIILPEGVTTLGSSVFDYCTELTSISIPNSLNTILKLNYFEGKDEKGFTFGDYFEFIGRYFYKCGALKAIKIPNGSVKKFEQMFPCENDLLVEWDEEENLSTEVTDEDLANAWTDKYGVKYSSDRKRLLKAPIGLHDYTIITGTKVICNWAFCEFVGGGEKKTYHGIHSITIPDSIVQVGEHAFICCDHLRYIYIPVLTRKKFEKIMPYCNMFVELLDLKNKDGWRILERRPFSRSEIETTSRAEVIDSQFGSSVGFFLNSGGFFHIPLVKYSSLAIGDIVDLSRANIVTLTKKGDGNIMRVEAFK